MSKLLLLFGCCGLFSISCLYIDHYSRGPGYDFNNFSNTPVGYLAKAVAEDDTAKIGAILKDEKIDVDFPDPKFGQTLLMLAVAYQQDRAVEKLLQCGADPNKHAKPENESPLIHSCFYNSGTSTLKLLIKYRGDVNSIHILDHRNGGDNSYVNETALMAAASDPKDGLDKVKLLVEAGADINKCTYYDGYGAITTAIIMGNLDVVKYLIIDKQAVIPRYCYSVPGTNDTTTRKFTVSEELIKQDYSGDTTKERLRKEIMSYLNDNGLR